MFDLIVLGGGPAGYHGAIKASEQGLSVALIEKRALGGVCLNEGCIPSKTFLHSSKKYASSLNFSSLQQRKEEIISTLTKGIALGLKRSGVTLFEGMGVIQSYSPEEIVIVVTGETICGKNLLIATGSTPIIPPITNITSPKVVTSGDLLNTVEKIESLVVIGGGVIGLEMATFFAEAGAKVTVIEATDSIGGRVEKECLKILHSSLKKSGISLLTSTTVTAITDKGVMISGKQGEEELEAEKVLLAVGREPNIGKSGFEKIGVSIEKGAIVTDNSGKTNLSNVFAAGDVNGKSMLAHTAYREAEVVVATILGKKASINYTTVPTVIYTHPEVASVGLTLEQALDMGIDAIEKKRPFVSNGRFLAETEKERGLCKVILGRDGAVLGVHLVGLYASELITTATFLVELKIQASQLESIIFPHPTVSEIIKDTIVED